MLSLAAGLVSLRLLLSNGFVKEGLLRENEFLLNEFCSTVVFGRLVTDV